VSAVGWSTADSRLQAAELLAACGDLCGAADRAYFACYAAARTLLRERFEVEDSRLRMRTGVHRLFHRLVVRPRIAPVECGRILEARSKLRLQANFGEGDLTQSQVTRALREAHSFVATCRLISETSTP
jgi:uncharacterized protein (UPF0332 family)